MLLPARRCALGVVCRFLRGNRGILATTTSIGPGIPGLSIGDATALPRRTPKRVAQPGGSNGIPVTGGVPTSGVTGVRASCVRRFSRSRMERGPQMASEDSRCKVTQLIPLRCMRCLELFAVAIDSQRVLGLCLVGVSPDEITRSFEQALIAQELVCPGCARGAVN